MVLTFILNNFNAKNFKIQFFLFFFLVLFLKGLIVIFWNARLFDFIQLIKAPIIYTNPAILFIFLFWLIFRKIQRVYDFIFTI